MDTKIAAALNNLNLNSQQKKIINEVLDNKFKYIEANSLNIKTQNIYFSIDDKGLNYNYYELINNKTFTKCKCTLKENELTFTSSFDDDCFSDKIPYGISIKNNIYTNRTPNTCTMINNNAATIFMGKRFTSGTIDDLFLSLVSISIDFESKLIQIGANAVECKDFKILDENNNAISVKDSIQDIYDEINNNIPQNIQNIHDEITQNIQDVHDEINNNYDINYITQSFIDKEIEELIYKTAEIRSKDAEYLTGEEFKELVISEKEYNKYSYTYDNTVYNNLHDTYNKIVVYKDILTKTINITNSNGEQEEINVLIVE